LLWFLLFYDSLFKPLRAVMGEMCIRNHSPTQDAPATSLWRVLGTRRRCSATGLHDSQKNTEVSL
jgi:hypothetical protein